jgi:hypothetical protein
MGEKALGQDLIAVDLILRCAAEAVFMVEDQAPFLADVEVAVAVLEEVQFGEAVRDTAQAEYDFGAAGVGARTEDVVAREPLSRDRLSQMDRQTAAICAALT